MTHYLVWLGIVLLGWLWLDERTRRKDLERRLVAFAWARSEADIRERPYKAHLTGVLRHPDRRAD